MARNRCFVEVIDRVPVRIFRTPLAAKLSPAYNEDRVREWPRIDATRAIREFVYKRSNGECERCGALITRQTGHMHEKVSRGDGGEISIYNSIFICSDCHIGRNGEHGNRFWGGRREI